MRRALRTLPCLLATVTIGLAAPPDPPKKPKLVLAIAIDQFRYDYLLRFRKDYSSGFVRLLEQGAVFTNAHYIHATTVTAVGHSTFLSGATPSISGIIANEWYDRESGQSVTSVFDPKTKLVGGIAGQPGSSPQRLLVSTVGDEVKMQGNDSKVIGISIKDRSAILPAGHMADGAYWYANESNTWVTSTYYRADLPDWAKKVNAETPYKKVLGAKWLPYDAANGSAKPFCTFTGDSRAGLCGSVEATPWGNEMIEEFAERAMAGENLGRHTGTDVLAVSFSSNDYVGHAVGPDDPAVRDMSVRTDHLLGKLFAYVDQRVGAGNILVVLTADHGVAPVPEVNTARKMPGGRLSDAQLLEKMNSALTQYFGPGKWILHGPATMPYLDLGLIRTHKLDLAEVEKVAADAARAENHIARVFTRDELENGRVQQDTISRAVTSRILRAAFGRSLHFAGSLLFVCRDGHFAWHPVQLRHARTDHLSGTGDQVRNLFGGRRAERYRTHVSHSTGRDGSKRIRGAGIERNVSVALLQFYYLPGDLPSLANRTLAPSSLLFTFATSAGSRSAGELDSHSFSEVSHWAMASFTLLSRSRMSPM